MYTYIPYLTYYNTCGPLPVRIWLRWNLQSIYEGPLWMERRKSPKMFMRWRPIDEAHKEGITIWSDVSISNPYTLTIEAASETFINLFHSISALQMYMSLVSNLQHM